QLCDLGERQAVGPRVDDRAACRASVWIWAEMDAVERRGDGRVASREVPAEAKQYPRRWPGRAWRAWVSLRALSALRTLWPSRSLLSYARRSAHAPRAADIPRDRLEALLAVAELQIAKRLLVAMRLDARVDDAVADGQRRLRVRAARTASEGRGHA